MREKTMRPATKPVAVVGRGTALDAAAVYARAVMATAYGPDQAEARYRALPARVALMWWTEAWTRCQSADLWH